MSFGLSDILGWFGEADKYGPFGATVAASGFAIAAATALTLGWMPRRGSSWAPPDEAVSQGTTRVASLATAVFLVLGYRFLRPPGHDAALAALAVGCILLTVLGLFASIHTMKTYGYRVETRGWFGRKSSRYLLGGKRLTPEAENIMTRRGVTRDRLVEEANNNLSLVFDRGSMADIHLRATAAFLALQTFGSLALGAVGLLLSGIKGTA